MKYYEEVLSGPAELKNNQGDFVYDLNSMRKRKVEEW